MDHILVQCAYATQVWYYCLQSVHLQITIPEVTSTWESWWSEARNRVQANDRSRFDTLVILVTWTLWKQRNASVCLCLKAIERKSDCAADQGGVQPLGGGDHRREETQDARVGVGVEVGAWGCVWPPQLFAIAGLAFL
jgi:hypothetical protein